MTVHQDSVRWRKSPFSNTGNCVEVADLPDGGAYMRHSQDSDGPVLTFNAGEWAAFLEGVKSGFFDPRS